jgi:hypothetical protein
MKRRTQPDVLSVINAVDAHDPKPGAARAGTRCRIFAPNRFKERIAQVVP